MILRVAGCMILLVLIVQGPPARAQQVGSLPLLDTASPQGTIKTLLSLIEPGEAAYLSYRSNPTRTTYAAMSKSRAAIFRLFDLSKVPPASRGDVAGDAMVFLVDVLKRTELPLLAEIPDQKAVAHNKDLARWTIPGTEINLARVMAGERLGELLFSPEMIARAGEFYSELRDAPVLRQSRLQSWRQEQLEVHGWLIPAAAISSLNSGPSSSIRRCGRCSRQSYSVW